MAAVSAATKPKPNFSQNGFLLPPLPSTSYLTPHMASNNNDNCSYNSQRRRNSYAASSTISENVNADNMMASGGSRSSSTTAHFLDPSMAMCRRRLPPTPATTGLVINEKLSNNENSNINFSIRRGSSPRILPTPPPHSPPFINEMVGGDANEHSDSLKSVSVLERRPSTGRRLPPEPSAILTCNTINSTQGARNSLDNPNPVILQRSVSTRNPHQFMNKSAAQLPPAPNSTSLVVENSNRLTRTTSSTASIPNSNVSLSSLPITTNNGYKLQSSDSVCNDNMNCAKTIANMPNGNGIVPITITDATIANKNMTSFDSMLNISPLSPKTLAQNSSVSAPQSPRGVFSSNSNNNGNNSNNNNRTVMRKSLQYDNTQVFESTEMPTKSVTVVNELDVSSSIPLTAALTATTSTITIGATTTKSTSSGSVSSTSTYIPARKYSDTFESSLARNGSMAFLLEQQHLLRREFCPSPETVPRTVSGISATRSSSSSLSPSIEQLNCTAGGSKSGSDVEEPSPCIDARMHGIDPSLYMASGSKISTSSSSLFNAADSSPTSQIISSNSAPSTSWNNSSVCAQSDSNTATTSAVSTDSYGSHPRPRGLGLIHCTLQHFPVRKRLRVSVLKIEGLAGELRPELEIQPFCKVNLLPGTKQKQLSVVKRGRDAVFNQEFFFDGIATEELDTKSLSIEVCHQSAQKLQKDLEIGEILVPLKDLTQLPSKKEVRIVEELKCSVSSKKFGKIYLTSCIEKDARRLTINLIKVDDLPKWGIIGAPDVCVRITLSQGSSPPQTKSSRVLKSTTSAVYKEAVMFLISTKQSDLQHTRITISVHDLSRSVIGDDVIGSVYLGELSLDKSEVEQWRQTVEHWGKEYKGCHRLKINRQNAPDVHVSETQSDIEDT